MNEPNINNRPKKSIFSAIIDVGSMPISRIAEIPLALFFPLNKAFEAVWKYLFENPLTEWMGDMKDEHPKAFWISGILWIPLAIIIYFYAIDLLFIIGIASVAGIVALTILFALLCKIIFLFNRTNKR